jgi:hypothetical protein
MESELLEKVNSVSNKMRSILEESSHLRTIIEERIARMETDEETEYSEESLESEEDTEVSNVPNILDIWRWFCSRRR